MSPRSGRNLAINLGTATGEAEKTETGKHQRPGPRFRNRDDRIPTLAASRTATLIASLGADRIDSVLPSLSVPQGDPGDPPVVHHHLQIPPRGGAEVELQRPGGDRGRSGDDGVRLVQALPIGELDR